MHDINPIPVKFMYWWIKNKIKENTRLSNSQQDL
jgi:hypothetical protein